MQSIKDTQLGSSSTSTSSSSFSFASDAGNLGAIFILGFMIGSGRWKTLSRPLSTLVSGVGGMAVERALEILKSSRSSSFDSSSSSLSGFIGSRSVSGSSY